MTEIETIHTTDGETIRRVTLTDAAGTEYTHDYRVLTDEEGEPFAHEYLEDGDQSEAAKGALEEWMAEYWGDDQ